MAKSTDLAGMPFTPEELAALIHEDFATFVQIMYRATKSKAGLVWAPYLDLMCAKLQAVADGKLRRLVITIPPRHLKSFCVSVALPAFILGREPTQQIMTVSYGQDLAKEFARDGLAIMQSEDYRRVFGEVLASARQPLQAIRTKAGGVRRATSLDGTATGVGGDLIIFDDPQKPGEILSDAIRKTTNEAFENTFLSRANDPESARMIIVMQRLHEDDFVGHVLGRGGEWEVINLPAIAEEAQEFPFETFMGPQVYRRRDGQLLHPARITKARLDEIRQLSGEALWATQYQQRPTPPGGEYVQAGWFRRFDADNPPEFDTILQSWDTANKVEQWNDHSVCTTWGLIGSHAYLIDVHRRRYLYPDLKRAVIELARLHRANRILIEDRASGTQLIQELREQGIGVEAVQPARDKKIRMISQTAKIEGGFVFVPQEAPWLSEYLHELVMFPNGRFDDQVDSTSQALAAVGDWSNNMNVFEFYRQEHAAMVRHEEDIWIMRGLPSIGAFYGIEGHQYLPDAYGLFHLPGKEVQPMINAGGTVVQAPSRRPS